MRTGSRLGTLAVIAALIALILGIIGTLYAFQRVDLILRQEYDEHLLALGHSVDRNLQNTLERCSYELQREMTRPRVLTAEAAYRESGSASDLEEVVRGSVGSRSGILSGLIVLDDARMLFSVGCGEEGVLPQLMNGVGVDGIDFCVDGEGAGYVCFTAHSAELVYIGLVALEDFYEAIVVESLQETYWIVLYDSAKGMLLENDGPKPTYHSMTPEDMALRRDGYSIVARADAEAMTVTETYSYIERETNTRVRCRMVALNSTSTRNGLFTIGLAADYERISQPRSGIIGWLLLSACLITVCSVVIVLLLRRLALDYTSTRKRLSEAETRLDRQEQAAHAQRLELMGSMTGAISHEFNNLLTPIMGYALMILEQTKEGEPVYGPAAEIYQAADRSKELIKRLSSLTRRNTGASYSYFCPDTVAERTLQVARPSMPDGVITDLRLGCEGVLLRASETQVMQVLLNLLLNAYQAIGERGGHVYLSTCEEGESIVFTVEDDGPGIPEEQQRRIFEPFYTTKELGKGTGLGLAISEQVARAHGGTLSVRSAPGKGACFTLRLPKEAADRGRPDDGI